MPSAKYVRKPLPAFLQVPLSTYRQGNLGKISFEHFDGSWESCWTPHRVCYKVCSSTRCGWHCEWVPLTLEGDRRTLKGIKTPNRAERQYHSDWTHPSGGSSEAHPPHHGSHVHVAQCSALEPPNQPCCLGLRCRVIWTQVPIQQSVTDTEMGLGGTTHALQIKPRTEHSSSLGWSFIYSTSEQENPSGHGKNHCGGTHRDIWTQMSLQWHGHMDKLRSALHL